MFGATFAACCAGLGLLWDGLHLSAIRALLEVKAFSLMFPDVFHLSSSF
jgi:hypothetical protein